MLPLHLALLAYVGAGVVYFVWLVRPRDALRRAAQNLLIAGAALHFASLALEVSAGGARSLVHAGGSLSSLAFLIVFGFIALDLRFQIPVAGAFVAPLVVAVLVPAHLVPDRASAVYGVGLAVHVGIAFLGTAVFALSFGLALLFLVTERQLKAKRLGRLAARLPSLDLVDRMTWYLTLAGFVLLSLTIASGAVYGRGASGLAPLDLKTTFAYVAWFTYAVVINARLSAGWRGRRAAVLVLAGFVLIVGVYLGVYRDAAARTAVTSAASPVRPA